MGTIRTAGATTHKEIFQQPTLWETTLERVRKLDWDEIDSSAEVVVTGAGTSAYAAMAIAAGWPGARAVATTDLITDHETYFSRGGILLSLARSGDSPESVEVVKTIQKYYSTVRHLAITCNAQGRLANYPGVQVLKLDPRTNDQSLVMTSSFSNLVLAGLGLRHLNRLEASVETIAASAAMSLTGLDEKAREIASRRFSRAVVLASGPMAGAARESSLKILELTAGQVAVLPESYLGLRHGPMSFLREDTLVLCFLSSSADIRRYEIDLLDELRSKKLGFVVAIAPAEVESTAVHEKIVALAPDLPDRLRTPFEIVFPQLLGFHLSLVSGLDPDNPSPDGVINRVVQGVKLYED